MSARFCIITCVNDAPLNEYRAPTCETCLQSAIPDYPVTVEQNDNVSSQGNEVYAIAPGESKHPVSFMAEKQCKELAFPVLFPKGKYGYSVNREIKLSPVKYFNARLTCKLHHSGRLATNPEYLFFARFITEQKKVSDSINIALKKMHGQPLTASQVRSNNHAQRECSSLFYPIPFCGVLMFNYSRLI